MEPIQQDETSALGPPTDFDKAPFAFAAMRGEFYKADSDT